jgi:transposase
MPKRKHPAHRKAKPEAKPRGPRPRRRKSQPPGPIARGQKKYLSSHTVGALPIINRLLRRMRLEEFLRAYLPEDDPRTKLPTVKGLTVLLKNLLFSREPLYGLGEWASRYAPDLLGLRPEELALLNDDRAGRCLDRLFEADSASFVLALVTHVVGEFGVRLDALHNDSTTVTFFGAYAQAAQEKLQRGRPTSAITWGHNKDHRPDLKQLLYILTVSEDGGVPVHFQVQSGNTTDDQTHQATWDVLCQLVGRRDFLYVADSKLATAENMAYLHQRGGRFVTVLPRTRAEDGAFRELVEKGLVAWRPLWDKADAEGNLLDRYSTSSHPATTAEGYRLLWYHSTRKAELDTLARSGRIERALKRLAILREKLRSPRTRYRQQAKVAAAVEEILHEAGAERWIAVQVQEHSVESYHQEHRGRAGKNTRYVKQVTTRFDLDYRIDDARVAEDARGDGLFPLVSNVLDLSEQEILWAYKRQPTIEKRFEQLKTDYEVAPVYLKEVRRIQSLLCMYFLVLLVEALLERELRQAMEREALESLPLYPEGRPCRSPTTRRLLDVFEIVQRHTLLADDEQPEVLVTELSDLQRKLLKLVNLPSTDYGR